MQGRELITTLKRKMLLVAVGLCVGSSAWADDVTTIPITYDYSQWDATNNEAISTIAPFDNGTIVKGTNVVAMRFAGGSAVTGTAYFDSDTETEGRQAYTLAANEKVTFTINAYHGYLVGDKSATISISNSDNVALASYTYNATSLNITDVKIGGTTVENFTSFGCRSYNSRNGFTNGAYNAGENNNPVITVTIFGNGDVTMNFKVANAGIDKTFTGSLGNDVKIDLAKLTVADRINNSDRAYAIGKLSIATETMSKVTVTTQYIDTDGKKVFADVVEEIGYGTSYTPTYTNSTSTTYWDYTYASGADKINSVTSDKIITVLYNKTIKSAYSAYTVLYAQDYDLSTSTPDWSTDKDGRFEPVILTEENNRYLTVNQNQRNNNGANLTSLATQNIVSEGEDFTITFDLKLGTTDGTSQTRFAIYDAANTNKIFDISSNKTTTWTLNENNTKTVELTGSTANTNINNLTWYSVKITQNGENTYLTITKKEDGSEIFALNPIIISSETGGIGKMTYISGRYNGNFAIDNIMIRNVVETEDLPATPIYTITTVYQLSDGTKVKADLVENVEEGKSYDAVYETTFDDDNYRYTYVSGAENIANVNENKTITIIYSREELEEHTVTVKAIGDYNKTLTTITVKDAKSSGFHFPRYLWENNRLYQVVKNVYNQGFWKSTGAVNSDMELTETYSLVSGYYPYFEEGENIATLTKATGGNVPARCSAGEAGYAATDAEIVTLPAGTYILKTVAYGTAGTTFTFKEGNNTILEAGTSASVSETTSSPFTVDGSTPIILLATGNDGSSPKAIDYVLIQRTGDQPISVSGIGYATFCPTIDLSIDPEGDIEACTASVSSDGKINYTVVNTVKAGEGVLLRSKNGGTATATATIIENATANGGNAFVGIPNKVQLAQSTESGYTNYILSKVNDVLGFYKVNANGSWCNAGTAYLKVANQSQPNGIRAFYPIWSEETSGIAQTENSIQDIEGSVYNMNGQRVAKPTKGLYIVNGKKVIIK